MDKDSTQQLLRGGTQGTPYSQDRYLRLHLPYPPTTNHLFANKPGGGRFASKAYQTWIRAAEGELWTQPRKPVHGPVQIRIALAEPRETAVRQDLDNRLKALLDFLVRYELIDGDHHKVVRRIEAQWGGVEKGAIVEVTAL